MKKYWELFIDKNYPYHFVNIVEQLTHDETFTKVLRTVITHFYNNNVNIDKIYISINNNEWNFNFTNGEYDILNYQNCGTVDKALRRNKLIKLKNVVDTSL